MRSNEKRFWAQSTTHSHCAGNVSSLSCTNPSSWKPRNFWEIKPPLPTHPPAQHVTTPLGPQPLQEQQAILFQFHCTQADMGPPVMGGNRLVIGIENLVLGANARHIGDQTCQLCQLCQLWQEKEDSDPVKRPILANNVGSPEGLWPQKSGLL